VAPLAPCSFAGTQPGRTTRDAPILLYVNMHAAQLKQLGRAIIPDHWLAVVVNIDSCGRYFAIGACDVSVREYRSAIAK